MFEGIEFRAPETPHYSGRCWEVKSSVFFQRYREYAERCGERALQSKELPGEMQRRGYEQTRTKGGVLYLGIELAQAEGPSWND